MLADHLIILNVRKIPTPVFSQSFSLSFPITSPIQYIAESHSSAFVSLIGTVSHLLRYEPLRFRKHNAISTGECVDEASKCGKVLTRKKLRQCIFMVVRVQDTTYACAILVFLQLLFLIETIFQYFSGFKCFDEISCPVSTHAEHSRFSSLRFHISFSFSLRCCSSSYGFSMRSVV